MAEPATVGGRMGGRRPRQIRALAIDVDGTLLDPHHEVTRAAREAIQLVREAGVRPVIATSRPPAAVTAIVDQLGLFGEPIVTCQGAVWGSVTRDGQFRARSVHRVAASDARAVTETAQQGGFFVSWFYADGWIAEHEDEMVEQEELITGATARRVASLLDDWPPPSKILIMAPKGREATLQQVLEALPSGLSGATSRRDYLETVPRGVSKWSALSEVYESYGIPGTHTAAIGDGNNDLEMITRSEVGIAMGHAPAEVLAAADWVAPDNRHEGFAAAVGWILRELRGVD